MKQMSNQQLKQTTKPKQAQCDHEASNEQRTMKPNVN
jgi:hypothetical protein